MRNYFNYDFTKKAIVGTKTAINKANAGNTPEYRELSEKLAAHPDFNVVIKNISRNEEQRKYRNLTFKKMKEYILTKPNGESKVKELEAVMKVAEAKGAKYPLTKKWFLNAYPEYKNNSIELSEEEMEKKAMSEVEALCDEGFDEEVEPENEDEELAA